MTDQLRLGISPVSWGVRLGKNPLSLAWSQFLDEVVSADYEGIELGMWGFLPTAPDRLRSELSVRSLSLVGGQLNADFMDAGAWPETAERTRIICTLLGELGARRLVLLSAPGQTADWSRMIARIEAVARLAREFGVVAVYHAHAGSPIETEADIERFLADTDVALCFDTGHHAYSGGEVLPFIKRHADRIAHVHLKNIRAPAPGIAFTDAVARGGVTELESGSVDMGAVRDALREVGYTGWAVVEQDFNAGATTPPAVIALRNRRYLRSLDF